MSVWQPTRGTSRTVDPEVAGSTPVVLAVVAESGKGVRMRELSVGAKVAAMRDVLEILAKLAAQIGPISKEEVMREASALEKEEPAVGEDIKLFTKRLVMRITDRHLTENKGNRRASVPTPHMAAGKEQVQLGDAGFDDARARLRRRAEERGH